MPTSDIKKGPLYVDSTNNRVGVGTSTPSALIHASGAAASGGAVEIRLEDTAASSNSRLMRTGSAYSYAGVGANETWLYHAGAGTINIGPDGGGVVKIVNNGAERLRIDSSGNVGIGTSSPSRKLALHNSGANSVFAQWTNGTTGEAGSNGYLIGIDGSGNIEHYNYESTDIKIFTAGTERMRIDVSGNVLVGKTSSTVGGQSNSVQTSTALSVHGPLNSHTTSAGVLEFNGNKVALRAYGATAGTGILAFNTGGGGGSADTERMRIDSSGKVGIGVTPIVQLDVKASTELAGFQHTSGTGTIRFYNTSKSTTGYIQWNNSTVSYVTGSDYRLKTAVTYDWDATTRLKQLRPARFEWIADGDDAVPVDGFLAHEVQDVVPEAISGTHNEVDDEGSPVYQGIDQSKLTPLLTKALIEAVEKIEQLEARITALETA